MAIRPGALVRWLWAKMTRRAEGKATAQMRRESARGKILADLKARQTPRR